MKTILSLYWSLRNTFKDVCLLLVETLDVVPLKDKKFDEEGKRLIFIHKEVLYILKTE